GEAGHEHLLLPRPGRLGPAGGGGPALLPEPAAAGAGARAAAGRRPAAPGRPARAAAGAARGTAAGLGGLLAGGRVVAPGTVRRAGLVAGHDEPRKGEMAGPWTNHLFIPARRGADKGRAAWSVPGLTSTFARGSIPVAQGAPMQLEPL